MIKEYNKKYKATQWIGTTDEELFSEYKKVCELVGDMVNVEIYEKACLLKIKYPPTTDKADMWVDLGNYVIKDEVGNISTCTEKDFLKNYNS